MHHPIVLLASLGLAALHAGSGAAAPAPVPPGSVWTVDDDGPADFPGLVEAIASPRVRDGDALLVHAGDYAAFELTKSLQVLATAGGSFSADATVRGVPAFTLAGLRAIRLRIEDVSGRGVVDDCSVGELVHDDDGTFWLGETWIERCDELLVTRSTLRGGDACYPEKAEADDAVAVVASRVAFVDCTIRGGDGAGEDCSEHYPTAGYGITVLDGDVSLAGTTVVGGIGPWDTTRSAVWLSGSSADVRGDARDVLDAPVPAAPLDGESAEATVSGVTLYGAPLPAWVEAPLEAEPFVRLLARGSVALSGEVHAHGPAGGALLLVLALEPALLPPPPSLVDPLWFDPASVIALLAATTLGQDAPVVLPLPALPSVIGTTPIVQGWMPASPAGLAYVTNPACGVVRR